MLSTTPPLTRRQRRLVILGCLAFFVVMAAMNLYTSRHLDRSTQEWQERAAQRGNR